jgi:superfamily I DNA/RNA helicase
MATQTGPRQTLLLEQPEHVSRVKPGLVVAGAAIQRVAQVALALVELALGGCVKGVEATRATHIALDTTYRCAREIVAHAGRLIARNSDRVPKDLTAASAAGGLVRVERAISRGGR